MSGASAPALLGARLAARRVATAVLAATGDPLAPFLRRRPPRDLLPLFARLHAGGAVHRSRTGALVVASHALCDRVLRDPRFRVRDAQGLPAEHDPVVGELGGALSSSFLELDPPDHTRLRRLAAPALRPRAVRDLRGGIEELVAASLDRAGRRGRLDVVADLALPLPVTVIARLLGIPDADRARFAAAGSVVGGAIDGVRSARQLAALRAAGDELSALFGGLARHRAEQPADDVVGRLAAAAEEGRLSAAELVQVCGLLLVAGFETTVNLIGNAVAALAAHPEQWRLLRADPGRAPAVVEEVLRWDSPVQATTRVAAEPLELAGHRVTAGTRVVLALGAANRDPAAHPDPDRFAPGRAGEPEHLAFASGIHYCLGAPLARSEAELALRGLAERLPELRPAAAPVRRPGTVLRGFTSMPLVVPLVVPLAVPRVAPRAVPGRPASAPRPAGA